MEKEQLKLVTVQHESREIALSVCVLGVRKGASDRLELLVFGKAREALLVVPLKPGTREQKSPLEFTAEREVDGSARVTLALVGKYEASFLVKKAVE